MKLNTLGLSIQSAVAEKRRCVLIPCHKINILIVHSGSIFGVVVCVKVYLSTVEPLSKTPDGLCCKINIWGQIIIQIVLVINYNRDH